MFFPANLFVSTEEHHQTVISFINNSVRKPYLPTSSRNTRNLFSVNGFTENEVKK